MLRETLVRIGMEYPSARQQVFSAHPTAQFIRSEAVLALQDALGTLTPGLMCKGSAGAGNWADVPWLAVFDPMVTESATTGYYVVYLFSADSTTVHLSLNQGTTAVRNEFKAQARDVLKNRAHLVRARLPDHATDFDVYTLALGSTSTLPKDYEAGHAFGRQYDLKALPSEQTLRSELQAICRAYLALTYRGGLDPSAEVLTPEEDEEPAAERAPSLIEIRRYRMHRRIERNPRASKKVKQHHGTICQACGFSFSSVYGPLGEGFIEAHHLKGLSLLTEGLPVTYDVQTDFVVLCANCHRMIHRTSDSADFVAFKRLTGPAR